MNQDRIKQRRRELRKKNKKKKNILPIIFIILILSGLSILTGLYYLTTPVDKSNNKVTTIVVKENYGSDRIAEELYNNKLIKSKSVFKLYSKMTSSTFYVGNFQIKPNMSLSAIVNELTNKEKAKAGNTFSVIEGDSILKIANNLEENTKIKKEDFLELVNDKLFINKLKTLYPNLITDDLNSNKIKYKLEGYLYPAKYEIVDGETAESLITKMVKTTNEIAVPLFNEANKTWNISGKKVTISIHDYITMASILEKESTNSENTKIAGVFFNRLKLGMPLQSDPTVNYSVDKLSGAPTAAELKTNSLYNTYINKELIPGPIASVSKNSYEALNNAEDVDYLYFLHASKDGKAYFAKTYAEHEELAKKYIEGYIATGS